MAKANKINTLYHFTVSGRHDFPHDMLRYDRCWPAAEDQSPRLDRPIRVGPGHKLVDRTVQMVGLVPPTEGRWQSFGWKVTDVQARSVG